jgi:NitT/TauT family transport system permease protein
MADTSISALAGLDALELGPASAGNSRRDRRGKRIAVRGWAAMWPKLLAIALVLAGWQVVYLSGWKKMIFPGPATTLSNLWDQARAGQLWHAVGITLWSALLGFAVALLIGGVVGALVSRIRPLRAAVGSLITALQTMPSIAWFPFAIILFGLTTRAILFVIVLDAAPSIANGLIAGVDYTPPLLLKAGRMMGLRRLSLYWHLILPAALPSFVAGLRQSWAFAWRSLMAGELLVLIANQPSLGVLLNTDQEQSDMTSAISIMIVILAIGFAVDALFGMADRRLRSGRGLAPEPAASSLLRRRTLLAGP